MGVEIRINVPDEFAAQARLRGLQPAAYAEEILARQIATRQNERLVRTPEQIRAWLDSLAQLSDKIPALPETISRDWLYQDHD